MAKRKTREVATEHISFRLTPELMKGLSELAAEQVDDSGRSLTAGQAARKIVVKILLERKLAVVKTN